MVLCFEVNVVIESYYLLYLLYKQSAFTYSYVSTTKNYYLTLLKCVVHDLTFMYTYTKCSNVLKPTNTFGQSSKLKIT